MASCRVVIFILFTMIAGAGVQAQPVRSILSVFKSGITAKPSGLLDRFMQNVQGGALAAFITCGFVLGVIGCEQGELRPLADVIGQRDPTAQEVIYMHDLVVIVVTSNADGKEYKEYRGTIGVADNGQIVATNVIGGGVIFFLQLTDNTTGFSLAAKQQNIGERVYFNGARGIEATRRSGLITDVFSNGYYLVAVDAEYYRKDDTVVADFVPYDALIYEPLLLKKDGSEFFGDVSED